MDMDLESAGMTYLLNQQDAFKGKFDVKQLLRGEENWPFSSVGDIAEHPLYKHFVPVGHLLGLDDDRAVMFLGVDDSSEQMNSSGISGKLNEVMNNLYKYACNNNFCAVVMDSAAGDQFSARLAVDSSDKIVFCMRPTRQFRVGTFNYLKRLSIRYGKQGDEKDIILLPTVVPQNVEIDGVLQLESSIEDIKGRIEKLDNLSVLDDFVSEADCFGINEIARFKWQEGVLYALRNAADVTADEDEGLRRYRRLAKIISR
jgi:hypothetical protein